MNIMQRVLHLLAPPGTSRSQLPGLAREAYNVWQREGWREVYKRTRWTLQSHWRGFLMQRGRLMRPYLYDDWMADHDPDAAELAEQRARATTFAYRPLFSIITPVYNPPPDILDETVRSVLAQSYPEWELLLVNGASDRAGVAERLDEWAERDPRIHVMHLDENLGISGNSNVALAQARGEFVSLLDHDDLLAPHTLFAVTERLNAEPEITGAAPDTVDIVYFDEDKISADGQTRRSPWFKPEFAPDTLLANNILMHCVLRRTLLERIGGFDSAMDGAQDWDVALRCSEVTDRIVHVPDVLYHWRQIEGSAALDANAKPWAYDAQARCITAHLARLGVPDARVEFPSLGTVRILWPTHKAHVSIIIPTKDKVDLLRACIDSILSKTTYAHFDIIVMDTGSTEPETLAYFDALKDEPRVQVIPCTGRFNFGTVNNMGAHHARGDVLLFLNNDTEVLEPTWLDEMVGWAMRDEVGAVGAKLIRPDDTIQHAGLIMGMLGHGSHVFDGNRENTYGIFGSTEWYRNYLAVTGACLMMRRTVFEEIGGYDETYEIGFSDIELCLRAGDAGYRTVYTPFARVLHHEGGSRGYYLPPFDLVRATYQLWPVIEPGDPNFNPNLSYLSRIPYFAHPEAEARDERLLYVLQQLGLAPLSIPTRRSEIAETTGKPAPDNVLSVNGEPMPIPATWPGCLNVHVDQHNGKPLITLVSHDLSRSGAPQMMALLARYLLSEGFDVLVLAPKEGPLRTTYEKAGIPVQILPRLLEDVRVAAHALAARPSVVVANTILSWQAVHVAKAFNLPSVLWMHESTYGLNFVQQHRSLADTLAIAERVVFPAAATAALYESYLADNATVIHNGLDPALLAFGNTSDAPASEEALSEDSATGQPSPEGADAKKLRVVHIGSIEERKGQDLFVQSIKKLPGSVMQSCEFFLVGRVLDPSFANRLRRHIGRRRNVHLVGEVTHEEAMAYLTGADIFVLASRDEVLPVTVLEAMCLGKPILTTRAGGIAEILEHETSAYLAPVEDVRSLARGLELLCTDPTLRARMGHAAQQAFQENLSIAHFGQHFAQLLCQVAAEHAGHGTTAEGATPAAMQEDARKDGGETNDKRQSEPNTRIDREVLS